MNALLQLAESLLRSHSYSTVYVEGDESSLLFEDDVVAGVLTTFESQAELLDNWNLRQESFLQKHSQTFRADPTKAWNLYSIFLAQSASPTDSASELLDLEENFHGTRKICRANVQSAADLEDCLSPLLKLRAPTRVDVADLGTRLRTQLEAEDRLLVLLLSDDSPTKIAASLLERP